MKIKKEVSMKNFLILFLIIFIPLFIFNQEEPIPEKNHYYLQEWINEDGLKEACLLEGDSIPPESLPEGFVEVSLEEIKQKGYLTGKEQLELARKRNGSIDSVVSGQDAGRQAYSWADAWNEGGVDKYVAGSLTSSTYDEKIRTVSRLRKWENNIIRHEHWGVSNTISRWTSWPTGGCVLARPVVSFQNYYSGCSWMAYLEISRT